jgi:hypothetical protein
MVELRTRGTRWLWVLPLLGGILFSTFKVQAQAPGYADISFPAAGEAVTGLVTILGSASHPFFTEYDLSFSYQEDPSDTWFFIAEHVKQEIQTGPIGIWDTSGITDGIYRLRLRVFLEGRETLVAISDNIRVRNYTRIETATPAPQVDQSSPTPVSPTSTPRPTPLPVLAGNGSQMVARAFKVGALLGVLLLAGGAFYFFARQRIRVRMGIMRSRRMLRQAERKNRRLS